MGEGLKLKMEMRGGEKEIGKGEDITPPLFPLSFSLHDSFLRSHCSSCFSPLPDPHPLSPPPSLLYCSSLCSSLHFSSAELHLLRSLPSNSPPRASTSDFRATLRLLHSLSSPSLLHGRISGFLTNREKLMADEDVFARVKQGARAIATARRFTDGKEPLVEVNENVDDAFLEEEAVLCLVLTNSVEVQDNEGRTLGIAVYDHTFSWINHSCSPIACYRFLITPPATPPFPLESRMRIVPAGSNGERSVYSSIEITKGYAEYGPRIIVRSIKRIKKNEEVTVAYTDLLQPKAIRQSEMYSKYRFICCCTRCASPASYIDHFLQEITAANLASSGLSSHHSFGRDEANRKLTDYVDEGITEYLSDGDPESCCEKLESILILGLRDEPLETMKGKAQLIVKVHPLHHLALNAYMILASAYRTRASDLLATGSERNEHQLKAFNLFRSGAAYSLFLAAASHHLLCFESSLIAYVANFWTNAGESLLAFARSSVWGFYGEWELPGSKHFSLAKHKCSLLHRFETNLSLDQDLNEDFDDISSKFADCISSFTREVWYFLIQSCHYLKMIKDPFDFSSIEKLSNTSDFEFNLDRDDKDSNCWTGKRISGNEAQEYTNQEWMNIFELGIHCLLYGEFLASICYGRNSLRTKHIQNLLYYDYEEN